MEDCGYYAFNAINRRIVASEESNLKVENTPYTAGGVSEQFLVYPLELPDDPIPTAITTVEGEKTVNSVRYYNVAGMESDVPFKGMNIVVKTYSDGSRTTEKIVK